VVKLDRYDIAILRILARDGRITKSKFAEEVSLSISPTWERVRKLEESGVIKGYRAELDWVGTTNASRIVVEVTLARHTERDMRRFEDQASHAFSRVERGVYQRDRSAVGMANEDRALDGKRVEHARHDFARLVLHVRDRPR